MPEPGESSPSPVSLLRQDVTLEKEPWARKHKLYLVLTQSLTIHMTVGEDTQTL